MCALSAPSFAVTPSSARASRVYRCSGCARSYGEPAWVVLSLARRIEEEEVRRLLCNWPAGLCVEVRRCSGCGRTIAAKRASVVT